MRLLGTKILFSLILSAFLANSFVFNVQANQEKRKHEDYSGGDSGKRRRMGELLDIVQFQVLPQKNNECGYHAFYNAVCLSRPKKGGLNNSSTLQRFLKLAKQKILKKREIDKQKAEKANQTAELGLANESVPSGDQNLSGGDIEFLQKDSDIRKFFQRNFNVSNEMIDDIKTIESFDENEMQVGGDEVDLGCIDGIKEVVNRFKNDENKQSQILVIRFSNHWIAVDLTKGEPLHFLVADSLNQGQTDNPYLKKIFNLYSDTQDIPEEIMFLIYQFTNSKPIVEQFNEFQRLIAEYKKDQKPFFDWLCNHGCKERKQEEDYGFIDGLSTDGSQEMVIDKEENDMQTELTDDVLRNKIITFLGKEHPRLKDKYIQNSDAFNFFYDKKIRFKKGRSSELYTELFQLSSLETPIIIVYDDGDIEFARVKNIPFIFNNGICKTNLENKFYHLNDDTEVLDLYKMFSKKKVVENNKKELEKKFEEAKENSERNKIDEEIKKQRERIYRYKINIENSKKLIESKNNGIEKIRDRRFIFKFGGSYDKILAPDIIVPKIGGYILIAPEFYDKYEYQRLQQGEKDFEEDILLIGVDLSGPVESSNSDGTLSRRDLTEMNLKSAILIGANLSYTDLTGSSLNSTDFTCSDLSNSLLGPYTDLRFSILENTNFDFATLEDAIVTSTRICNGTSFRKAILNNLNFSSYDEFNIDNRFDAKYKLIDLDFFRAQLNRVSFTDCLLERIDMRQVKADMIFFNNTTMNDVDFSSKAELRNFLLFNTEIFGKNINFEDSLIENGIFLGKTEVMYKEDKKGGKEETDKNRSLLSDSNFRFTTILNTLFISFTFKNCVGLEQTRQLTNSTFENFELEMPDGIQSGVSLSWWLLKFGNEMKKNDEIINHMRACGAKINSYIYDDFKSIWNEYSNGWLSRVDMRLGTIAIDSLVSYGTGGIVNGVTSAAVGKVFGNKESDDNKSSKNISGVSTEKQEDTQKIVQSKD